ncbi:DNA polymerase III subunit chi [Novosphingobium sp. KA1]|uniref:DNA polymerase III subunit chi n=1 Tax=Novosphingobium sp. (strain KA1) TaxID=164608 RepID=UPI001A8D8437|nr:DNA polymerase III subunit chi [Novosphingobium sp. KA1]QSR18089.1 DNA polymerase III subunit chi [Novosphingobium sp. KA1]
MRVDFYQLSRDPAESALALIAGKVAGNGERLLVVSGDLGQRQRICQALWSVGPESFLANGFAGENGEDHQPILISDEPQPANGAKFMAIADGRWREGAEPFARTFFLFDQSTLQHARDTWRALREREGVEHYYWKQDGGRWVQAG